VDYETACLRLPDSKTGAKDIPLNSPALEALATMPRYHDNPHVIPGAKPGAHLVNLSKPWRRIRARAGLSNVRLHDLRHSYASVAAASGLGLPIIGALLGHTQAQTTKRYTHLAMDPLRAATEEVGKRIAAALTAPAKVKVLPLRRQ
jgi:integrase